MNKYVLNWKTALDFAVKRQTAGDNRNQKKMLKMKQKPTKRIEKQQKSIKHVNPLPIKDIFSFQVKSLLLLALLVFTQIIRLGIAYFLAIFESHS